MLLPSGRSNSDVHPIQTTQKPQLLTRISSPQLTIKVTNKLESVYTTTAEGANSTELATSKAVKTETGALSLSPGSQSENATNCSVHPADIPGFPPLLGSTAVATAAAVSVLGSAGNWEEIDRHLKTLQEKLKNDWTVHVAKEGRLYYCNHVTQTSGWLPSSEDWSINEQLPYGWERAVDSKGRTYYINHLNKTSTYEAPESIRWGENPPEPRMVILQRSPTLGFGFVAGSERPVIVRFVTDGGPSMNKLQPGDHILVVNGEDVKEAPRDHVIQLVRACESQVTLMVCQPAHNLAPGRKSTLLSAGKRAKLRTRPSRVRFAESVCVNGSPLFPASAFSLGDICVPPMANVLKVFLENGQTKSFKYDATTSVQDVVGSLLDKLCLSTGEIFSLVLEHVKSLKRNKLTLLDPEESLARIAARPGAHKLRCLFRITFVPISAAGLAQKDLNALDYLYMQCCNDVTQERFAPELQPEVALRLAALHMHQHALANNVSPTKLTVKVVEREFGLERFVPISLFEGMKRKELRRLISHFLKLNAEMTGSSTKVLTQLQAKLHYLDIIASLPSYGAKCFSTNQREGVERVLLLSPRFGLSQISSIRNSVPQPISAIEDFSHVVVSRDDDVTCNVAIFMQGDKVVRFSMEDRDACEFSLVLAGYHRLLTGKKLQVEREREQYNEDNAPSYLAQHTVLPATWSYLLPFHNRAHSINFLMAPPYHPIKKNLTFSAIENQELGGPIDASNNHCDRNMNSSNVADSNQKPNNMPFVSNAAMDLDIHSVMATELLEEAKDSGMSDSSGGGSNYCERSNCSNTNAFIEAKNKEVLRRVHEMQKMVESSEQYLNEQGELVPEYAARHKSAVNCNFYGSINSWQNELLNPEQNSNKTGAAIEFDSDCDSINSSKVSSTEDTPQPGALKHSDSLVLLAEAINQDLNGITQSLNSIGGNHQDLTINISSISAACSPRPERKFNNFGQLLSNLQANTDFSQSESDSESVNSPTNSPTARRPIKLCSSERRNSHKQNLAYRSSFGLHSPDGSNFGPDTKDYNLKEYLKQLKEISNVGDENHDTDVAAKQLSEIYGFEIRGDTFIETDADLIDLRAIPPPRTPDELDSISLLNAAPQGFDDGSKRIAMADVDGDLDKFLAKVVVAPPTQRATPAKELTPEEIMSFIIPPPPSLEEFENSKQNKSVPQEPIENLYSNSVLEKRELFTKSSKRVDTNRPLKQGKLRDINMGGGGHVIEYATVERKGKFSCCPKSAKEGSAENVPESTEIGLKLPPRSKSVDKPPVRPPKSAELIQRFSPKKQQSTTDFIQQPEQNFSRPEAASLGEKPPTLPPRVCTSSRVEETSSTPSVSEAPQKPPLPPIANRPTPRNTSVNITNSINGNISPVPTLTPLRVLPSSNPSSKLHEHCPSIPTSNGHQRSSSDYPSAYLHNPATDKRPPLSLLCSPQMARKMQNPGPVAVPLNPNISHKFSEKYIIKNGHVIDSEALLAKTDIAMAGLLVRLDQVAAQCSAAQLAGGGTSIDEDKFQRARNELTEQTLVLVTASKFLVVAMSDMTLSTLPEHLTSCLTAIRRITELTQDMTRHTSSPLQTRNIVLKVHDVASSFRELVGVQIGPLGAGQLALQAECLANVLATLLRSLRVFSP
ncbi:uncharacterized protein LOC128861298 [Anastrepha ludens]|uniref:uncharacterized protein LOC128861298 n=1 Tax=Anastrepha ludens TaxID=28586 RepID=UPI0023B1C421|nr:uncharacterized protein LOC128861298 [Anastrepha ludens]